MKKHWIFLIPGTVLIVAVIAAILYTNKSNILSSQVPELNLVYTNNLTLDIRDENGEYHSEYALSRGEILSLNLLSKGNQGEKLAVELETDDQKNIISLEVDTDFDNFTLLAQETGSYRYSFHAQGFDGSSIQKNIDIRVFPGLESHAAADNDCTFTDTDLILVTKFCEAGVITGYGDNTFRPENNINRAEIVTILYRFFGDSQVINDLEIALKENDINPFLDMPSDHWAAKFIAYGKKIGSLNGYEGSLYLGQNNINRAEAWKIMTDAAVEIDEIIRETYNQALLLSTDDENWFDRYYRFGTSIGMSTRNNDQASWQYMGQEITRLEVLEFLFQILEKMYQVNQ